MNERRDEQFELPNMPPPMTENRAKELRELSCKRCQVECDYCIGFIAPSHPPRVQDLDFDPLGR